MTSQIRVRLKKFGKSERERKRVTLNKITKNIGKTRKNEFSPIKNTQRNTKTSTNQIISTSHSRICSKKISENIEILSDVSDNEPVVINNEIKVYPLGEVCPIDSKWQKEKCKILNLTFISGILFENQSSIKNLDIRCLAPWKEKRIAPDGNCLFSSLSYILQVMIAPTKKSEYYY